MSIEIPLESASLAQLQQTPIDNVLNIIDQGLVHLPSYRELFYRWERQQWRAQEIDFTPDRLQFEAMSPQARQERMYGLSAFFREVLGIERETLEDTLEVTHQYMNSHLQYILIEALSEVAERIRQEPAKIAYLVEGITLYHVIVEGALALTGQRNILDLYRQNNLFPAFRGGFTAVARDESRHVVFGVKFLREMIQRDAANAKVIQAAVDKYAPVALKALTPTDEAIAQMLAMQADPWTSPRYAQDSLRKKLKVVGLSMELPHVPPPPVF